MSFEKADEIRQFVVSPIQTNCYAYVSQGECMVVDPGGSGALIAQELDDVDITLIVATHGHGDHVGGIADLKEATGAAYLISALDAKRAMHINTKPELGIYYDKDAPEPDRTLTENDRITVGTALFRVLETPGHTPGSICLVGEGTAQGIAFTGDTLFKNSCGRCDLEGGDVRAMTASLSRLAKEIPPETTLLCGHGESSVMSRELRMNPFLMQFS